MDEDEVQKQLDHMVKFIYKEADEKANEITAKALEEFSIEKSRLVREERVRITKEFEKKEKQIEVQKKIAYSNELNHSRLQVLKAREEGVQKLLHEAYKRLGNISKDAQGYKKLLHALIVQGLLKLQEPKVLIICRKQDLDLVKSILPEVTQEYTKKTEKPCEVTIGDNYLPPGPETATNEANVCSGGIVLSTNEGKIICANTLDARLSMVFDQKLPEIRTILFGESLTRMHKD
jgi:V-type H+-transporting ATPase subunit E